MAKVLNADQVMNRVYFITAIGTAIWAAVVIALIL